jgi:hypothetical protein
VIWRGREGKGKRGLDLLFRVRLLETLWVGIREGDICMQAAQALEVGLGE